MEEWLGLAGAVLGAILGWAMAEASGKITRRRQATRAMESAAFVCLDRLLKIRNFQDRNAEEQVKGETWNLGGDLDRYRDAIANAEKGRQNHFHLYKETMSLLLNQDYDNLSILIEKYMRMAGS